MTVRSLTLSALLILGGAVGPLQAQETSTPSPQAAKSEIDVNKLPLDLSRLQKKLQAAVSREEQLGPNRIRYNIDVLGTAPRVRLIAPGDDLRDAPTPYGAPTHREMMNYATPQEFRAPTMDFNSLMRWIQSKVGSKS
jgi:hypothetical protein